MKLDKKPKCRGCNQVGEEKEYYWQPDKRGKGGYLWHYNCYIETAKKINKTL